MADHEPESSSSEPPPPLLPHVSPSLPPAPPSAPPAPPPPEPWMPPPPAPPPLSARFSGEAKPMASRARLATVGVAANMLATAVAMVAVWRERTTLVAIRDGETFTNAELEAVDSFTALAGIGYLATWILAIVVFLLWFSRAYKNIGTWSNNDHSDGWAVGAWFVPFLNLWRPFKIAEEIVQKSPHPIRYGSSPAFRVWWLAFLTSNLIGRFVFRQSDETLDAFIRADTIELVGDAVWLVAGVAVIVLIRSVTATQESRIANLDSSVAT